MNLTLKLIKVCLVGSSIYYGAKAVKLWGYVRGYSDSAEAIFDALDMDSEEAKREALTTHSEIASTWKELKSTLKELKATIKK